MDIEYLCKQYYLYLINIIIFIYFYFFHDLNVTETIHQDQMQQYYQIISSIHKLTFDMNHQFKNNNYPYSKSNFYAVPRQERSRTVENQNISKQTVRQSKDSCRTNSIITQRKLSQKQKESLDDISAETINLEHFLQPIMQAKTLRQRNNSSSKQNKIAQFHLKNKSYFPIERQNYPIIKRNQSKDKLRKGQFKIIERKKRKLNSSLIQRIVQTLEYYPCLMGNPYKQRISQFKFSTQQSDDDQSSNFLQMKMINMSKLVLLTESKLRKNVEGIYDYALSFKGCQKQNKKFSFMVQDGNISMTKIIKGFLFQKCKTEKLCRQNLVNLCYSLYFHFDRLIEQYSLNQRRKYQILDKIRYYQIFKCFLTFKYDYEDLIFYLYSLSIFKHLMKMQSDLAQVQGLSNQNIEQFLIILSGNDEQLIQTYKQYIKKSFPDSSQINLYSLLYYLINDYRKKREYAKENIKISFISQSLEEGLSISEEQDRMEDGNGCSDIRYDYDMQFWSFKVTPEPTIKNPLCNLLQNELVYQSKKLIQLLCPCLSIQHRNLITQLLLMKAIRMFNCINQKGSYLWQRQMKLNFNGVMKNEDLSEIERLQRDMKILSLNADNESLQQRMIIQFVKALLTSRKLLEKLRELIEYFQSLTL